VTIAGLVHDAAQQGLRKRPVPMIYVPAAQRELPMGPSIVVRGDLPASVLISEIRLELRQLGSEITLVDPKTVRQRIDESIFQDRLLALLGGFFGALALVLAGVGLYGVVAYTTTLRSGEIGIRVALGAQKRAVLWLVLRDALALVGVGLATGLPLALVAGHAVGTVLFAVPPADTMTFTWTAIVLLGAGIGAALLPARRAAAMDPVKALRHQ
jgi:ABC-type antimicrobial peptide transport system permease subunit